MFKIQTLNTISPIGLNHFPPDLYQVTPSVSEPDAILVRSHKMHDMLIPNSVKVIGRAGAGLNNIPMATLTSRGIPVFNTPGANANAVCELVIAGMLLASRHICRAWAYVDQLAVRDDALSGTIEEAKKQFVGFELAGKRLGVVGLGSIGVKVANAAHHLGMHVVGYDPAITVNRAWELSSDVKQAHSLSELLREIDFLTLHVPLTESTKHMINAACLKTIQPGLVLLNFARDGIIDNSILSEALANKQLRCYVTDFPSPELKNHPQVISLPHIGASTKEAEENCAVMIAKQVRAYLEHGTITNSANFPTIELPQQNPGTRLAIANANIPNMVAQISAKLAAAKLNIVSLMNKSKENVAYTVIDLSNDVNDEILKEIKAIEGILQMRVLKNMV